MRPGAPPLLDGSAEEVGFQTKPEIAMDQIRAAVTSKVAHGIVLADAAYGINTEFREPAHIKTYLTVRSESNLFLTVGTRLETIYDVL
jgi:SRSO17 transposase